MFPGEPALASFIGAKDGAGEFGRGGDYWNCKMCKDPVKSSISTYQHPDFYRPDAVHVAQPTTFNVKALKVNIVLILQ